MSIDVILLFVFIFVCIPIYAIVAAPGGGGPQFLKKLLISAAENMLEMIFTVYRYLFVLPKKRKENLRNEVYKEHIDRQNRKRENEMQQKYEADMVELLKMNLILDSCVWMNLRGRIFISLQEVCEKTGLKINLLGQQLDEIVNIKAKHAYGSSKNSGARAALNRIDRFTEANLINMIDVNRVSKRNAYGDKAIIHKVVTWMKNGKKCAIVTDDIDLRIRLRSELSEFNPKFYKIVDSDYINPPPPIGENDFFRLLYPRR